MRLKNELLPMVGIQVVPRPHRRAWAGGLMTGCTILDSDIVARKNGKRLPCEVLEDENAKLRERVDATHFSRLLTEKENEALRAICARMYQFWYEDDPVTVEINFGDMLRDIGVIE